MAGINRFSIDSQKSNQIIGIFNESVCGLVFDTSMRSNVFSGYTMANQYYGNGQICELTSMDEVEASGITENGIMNGVPYYHLKHFFTMAAKDTSPHSIYVVFEDCSSSFQVFNRMMQETGKRIFQFGVWTERDLFNYCGEDLISPLLTQINEAVFSFKETFQKSDDYDLDIPYNVVLCANPPRADLIDTTIYLTDQNGNRLLTKNNEYLVAQIGNALQTFNYRTLPSVRDYDIPGLSVLIGQERSDEVHTMQAKNVNDTPVGCIGAALGVLTLCPVEYSIADNTLFSLRDVIPVAELGFGFDNTPMDTLSYVRKNGLDLNGYIFPTDKDGYIGETFFSSDRTLGSRDYCNLVRCRTINKVHRIVRNTMIRQINNAVPVNPTTGKISQTTATSIANDIYNTIDSYMGISSSLKGAAQLDYRQVTVPTDQDLVNGISLSVEIEIKPGNHTASIIVSEEVSN